MNVYVGARYVPKIMGAWEKNKSYEALSVVTYEGNSYTSKGVVPANTEITNENFWVCTGDYNAQVEAYKQSADKCVEDLKTANENIDLLQEDAIKQVVTLSVVPHGTTYKVGNKISTEYLQTMENKYLNAFYKKINNKEEVRIACVGDSLTYGVDTANGVTNTFTYLNGSTYTGKQASITYPMALESYLNKIYGSNIFTVLNMGKGGDYASESLERHNGEYAADLCLLMLGINDSRNSSCPYKGNITKFIEYMEQIVIQEILLGKAVVLLSPMISPRNNNGIEELYISAVKFLADKYCIPFINTTRIVAQYDYSIYSDKTHLNSIGYTVLGTGVGNAIAGHNLMNPVQVSSGVCLNANENKRNFILNGGRYEEGAGTGTPDTIDETISVYARLTSSGQSVTIPFYAQEDNLLILPNIYSTANNTITVKLDNEILPSDNITDSSIFNPPNPIDNNINSVVLSTNSTTRFTSDYLIKNGINPLRVAAKGWHSVTIELTSLDTTQENACASVLSVEFLSFNIYNLYKKTYNEKPKKIFNGTVSEGEITLSDDITKYDTLYIQTGMPTTNTLVTSTVKAFISNNFRVNEDTINCQTDSGKFKATIKDNTTLTIVQCDNPIRCIWGYNSKYDFK